MKERIEKELALLRRFYPDLEYREDGHWIRIPRYQVPGGTWNHDEVSVSFQIPAPGYPGQAPYAFYVSPGLRLKETDQKPNNYEEPAAGVPFDRVWGKFSWTQENWRATGDVVSGSNLFNFVSSFRDRLNEGA